MGTARAVHEKHPAIAAPDVGLLAEAARSAPAPTSLAQAEQACGCNDYEAHGRKQDVRDHLSRSSPPVDRSALAHAQLAYQANIGPI